MISTHTPLAGRDQDNAKNDIVTRISTHTPLAGRDLPRLPRLYRRRRFLLTRPSRGATQNGINHLICLGISTHTPLAGRDAGKNVGEAAKSDFYSHAPRGARLDLMVLGDRY